MMDLVRKSVAASSHDAWDVADSPWTSLNVLPKAISSSGHLYRIEFYTFTLIDESSNLFDELFGWNAARRA